MADQQLDYSKVTQSDSFRHLIAKKRKFIFTASAFFLIFYFTLPILTSYFTILNQNAIGPITWAWVFAFAQFVMTWVLTGLYSKKANQFDTLSAQIINQEMK
jgi:uncharacterized membrane protein (DUF485 family)